MKWLLSIILPIFLVSCGSHKEPPKAEKPQEEAAVSRDEAVQKLPCFRCHSIDRFNSRVKGVFPHIAHRDTGFHCNQCHLFEGHHKIVLNTGVCKTCHELKSFMLASTSLPSRFNHELHGKLGCKECHLGIFQMKRGTAKLTMDAMYQGRYCGECHNGKRAFASTECTKCHDLKKFDKELLYKVEGVGNVVFSHKFHIGLFTCGDCHNKFFQAKKTEGKMPMAEMEKGKFCGGCHNGNGASNLTDCSKCHKM